MKRNKPINLGASSNSGCNFNIIFAAIKKVALPLLIGIFFCAGLAHASPICGYHPSGIDYCIPLTIQNSQATIANGTQLEVIFNQSNSSWSGYITANADNICFYNGDTGACMPAWLEGNLTNSGAYSTTGNFNTANVQMLYWIKTDNSIPTGTSNQIYIGIFTKNTDNYGTGQNGILGTNPELNCSIGCPSTYYGGADNGANVFNLYDNFEGNYTDNGIITGNIDNITSAQNSDWVVDNGLRFSASCQSCEGTVYVSSGKYSLLDSTEDLAFDVNINPFYGILAPECVGFDGSCNIVVGYCYQSDGVMGFYSFNSSSKTPVNSIDMGALVDSSEGCTGNPATSMPQQDYLYSNNGFINGIISRSVFQSQEPSLPYTLVLQNGNISAQNLYNNSNIYTNKTIQYPGFTNDDVFAISNNWVWAGEGYNPYTDRIQWIRVRTPPSNDIQPKISLGKLITLTNESVPISTTSTSTTTISTTSLTSSVYSSTIASSLSTTSSTTIFTTSSSSSTTTSILTTIIPSTTSTSSILPTTSLNTTSASSSSTSTILVNNTNSTIPEVPNRAGGLNIVQSGGGLIQPQQASPSEIEVVNYTAPNQSLHNMSKSVSNTVSTRYVQPQNSTSNNTGKIIANNHNLSAHNTNSIPKSVYPAQKDNPAGRKVQDYTFTQIALVVIFALFAIFISYFVLRRKFPAKKKKIGS